MKHLIPIKDTIEHEHSSKCHCNPVECIYKEERFMRHVSYNLMDVCEKVKIKTSAKWEWIFVIE